jgi:hypothetical protein
MRLTVFVLCFVINLQPSLAQERQWRLDASDKDAFLVFGVPDTDDAGLSFWCKIGSGTVSIFAPFDRNLIKKDQTAPVELAIDEQKFAIKMKASLDVSSKTGSLQGPVSVDGTVMQAVANSNTFSFTAFGQRKNYPLADADVAGLLRVCGGF